MRVLLAMNYFDSYVRLYEPVIRELLRRGHEVHVGRQRERDRGWGGERALQALREHYPQLSWSRHPRPDRGDDEWGALLRLSRRIGDYLDSLLAPIDDRSAQALRTRRRAPARVVRTVEQAPIALRCRPILRSAVAILDRIERAIPPMPALVDWIAAQRPDVVLLSPMLMPGTIQTEMIRAGQALGLPTGLCVASWDNLSTKQRIRVRPDLVTVWNEMQRQEAIQLHGLAPETVETTGAQVYDEWFTWSPRPRHEFCRRIGLQPDRPYVLYVGGALWPAAITEAEFVARWVERLRSSPHPVLRHALVLVRPHPKRNDEWRHARVEHLEGVVIWPPAGVIPVEREAKADFFDSLYHSAAVVGINTSAMIEAGIVGRPVLAPLVPEFADSQVRTFHFRYLAEVGGGLLQLGSLDEHFDQLAAALAAGPDDRGASRGFLEAFVRPHGLEVPAAQVLADAIERLARVPARRSRRPASGLADRALRLALEPARARADRAAREHDRRLRRERRRRRREAVQQDVHGRRPRCHAG